MTNEPNNGQGNETPHKRRVRYKGTHPRAFHEKYKEANPEKYADTIEKVIRKGSTPATAVIQVPCWRSWKEKVICMLWMWTPLRL